MASTEPSRTLVLCCNDHLRVYNPQTLCRIKCSAVGVSDPLQSLGKAVCFDGF